MRKLSVAFRVDASIEIGAGHVMRCLTLADALSEIGATCLFICRAHPGNLLTTVSQRGYQVVELPAACQLGEVGNRIAEVRNGCEKWLGAEWSTDADQTLSALPKKKIDWLVVDHYAIDARWERRIAKGCKRILIVDDLANREHHCNLLVDQNLGRSCSDYDGLVNQECTVLVGTGYAMIRPEFAKLRTYSLRRRDPPSLKHLLVAMGGMDKDNVTSKVLTALRNSFLPVDLRISVVIGSRAPSLGQVYFYAKQLPSEVQVLVDVTDMAQLIGECDLAIGAAGSSSWERCTLGLPTIILVLAKNQESSARALVEAGAAVLIESVERPNVGLRQALARISGDPNLLLHMSKQASQLCDGGGITRVCQRLLALAG